MVFVRIILIILGVYLLLKLIFRGLLQYLFGNATKNLNDQIKWQQEEMIRQSKKQQGRITINYHPKTDKNFSKDEGDYIDFEEVK